MSNLTLITARSFERAASIRDELVSRAKDEDTAQKYRDDAHNLRQRARLALIPTAFKDSYAISAARSAAILAPILEGDGIADAREASDEQWGSALRAGGIRESIGTRAATAALMDVHRGEFDHAAVGTREQRIDYSTTRKAARLARVLIEAGTTPADATDEQWSLACAIIGTPRPASPATREAAQALAFWEAL